jgi:hypothetical protein
MDINIKEVIGGTGLAAALRVIFKYIRRKQIQPESMNLQEAVEFLKRAVMRIEFITTDIPSMREQLALHDMQIEQQKKISETTRFDLLNFKQRTREDLDELGSEVQRIKRHIDRDA